MNDQPFTHKIRQRCLILSAVGLISLGMGLRLVGLGDRIFWVDEVITALRIAGYRKTEVVGQLSDAQPRSAAALVALQFPTPRNWPTLMTTLRYSPEHAPLYFVLTRAWRDRFGASIVSLRSFSVLCSLLMLPAIGYLASRLFGSSTAIWAMLLLSLSPYFVAYAQEARPYSLWGLTLLLATMTLTPAWQRDRSARSQPGLDRATGLGQASWLLHGLTLALALYTSLLTGLVLLSQGISLAGLGQKSWRRGGLGLLLALVAIAPWLGVVVSQPDLLHRNTTWTRVPIDLIARMGAWLYNLTVLFFDVPVNRLDGWTIGKMGVALLVLGLIGLAFHHLSRVADRPTAWIVLPLALTTPAVLLLGDAIRGTQVAAAARYLLPFQLGTVLAVAYLFDRRCRSSHPDRRRWRIIAAGLIGLCLISCGCQLQQSPKYQKSRSLHNLPIAAIVNQSTMQPLHLWGESSQTLDLLSLSHSLRSNVWVHILPPAAPALPPHFCPPLLLFNPSEALRSQLQQSAWQLEEIYQPPRLSPSEIALSLWQVTTRSSTSRSSTSRTSARQAITDRMITDSAITDPAIKDRMITDPAIAVRSPAESSACSPAIARGG